MIGEHVEECPNGNVDGLFDSDEGHGISYGMRESETSIRDFAIRRDDFSESTFFERSIGELRPGQVLLQVSRFALTANNLSYATAGDALGYWKFFPTEPGWGRLPCFAFADVARSNHGGIAEGDRYFGYFPMSTHLIVEAERVREGSFVDGVEHRRALPAAYNQYTVVGADPYYREPHEDAQMLLKPLFITSFLVDDFLADNGFFGASQAILTSASSKTSIALAFQLRQRSLEGGVVALTSERNRHFVESLGFYDRVLSYEALRELDPNVPVVAIDMAGSANLTRQLHDHFGDRIKHDCLVGATHRQDRGPLAELPGAKPQFFFAPAQIKKRSADWGREGLGSRVGDAWIPFVESSVDWLAPVRGHGDEAVRSAYGEVVRGETEPAKGHVLSL